MDDLLNQLMTTDDDKEVVVLLRKAAYVIQRSAANAGALRSGDYDSCSRVAGGQDADDKDYIVYITNSLVTLLLYYINDVKVLRPATDALVALTGKFQWLKEVMGQAGLHHNLIGPLKQQIKAQYGRSNEATSYAILECIMELYLVMTYGSHDNLQRCKETSLIGMLVPQFDDRHASLQLCLTNLKLLSFMISASELGKGAETSEQLRRTWRRRCLLHERSWSIVTVDDDNTPIEHESEASILSRVLWIMNSFLIDTTDIQLYGLMCLSSFLVEDGGHQLLWLGGAFDSALHACFFYVGCLEVQQHAFLFMRNLLFRLLCSDEQTGEIPLANVLGSKYDMISQVVGCALHTYFHSDEIMISVCDIIKVLLLASDGFGERMIYDGLPRTLMQMLPQQKRADSNDLNGSVVATNDVRQHILSCIHLFASKRKNCGDIAHSLIASSHDTSAVVCMMLLGTSVDCKNSDGDTLLMSACLHSYTCVVESILNTAYMLSLHGISDAHVDVVKSCVKRLAQGDVARSSISVGLLLRYLAAVGDVSAIEWKNLGLDVFTSEMLDIALTETLETKSADIESDDACGEALCQEVLASYWISGCNGDPFENLKLKYAAAVERSSDCALQLQGQSCSSLFTKSLCSCKNEEKFLPAGGNQSNSYEDKDQIHFQDHLHISFDDSDDDSRFEMAVEDAEEFKIRARNDSNADICEKCVLCQRSDGVVGSAQRSDAFRTLSSTVDDDTINVNRKVALLDVSRNLLSSMTTFASIPVSTAMLEGLEVLLANSNRLTEFRCKLAQHLCNLKELKLSHNNLLQFPMSVLTHCPHLMLLDLTHNGLRDLDLEEDRRQRESWKNGISSRFSGTEVDGNQIFAPAFLHKNLLTLKMAHNQLTRFPYHICPMLPKLRSLDVSSNEIEDLSVYMVDVEVSEHINLSHNSIKFIPDAFITKICKTKHLDLSWNSISEVSDFDGMGVTSALNKLNLSHNQIDQFPGVLLNMKRLKVLNLSSNQISSFPELCAPTALMKDLDLSVNKITDIGKFLKRVVGTWAHTLRSLRLNNNLLQCLPADVGMLRNLEVLELQYNQLTKLPDDIGRLLKLYQLSLAGNNLDIDDSILSGRAQELRGYFYSRLKRSKERNNVQLTILSDDSCDKGRFMDSLATGCDFALKTSVEEITNVYLWPLRSAKRSFQVTVWDCDIGPDSIFKAHPQLLLCEQALYVLLVDPDTNSEDTLRNRLLAIATYAPHCPTVIIELSKTSADVGKVSEPRGSSNSLLKKFGFGPNICHCLRFDAKDVTQGNVAAFSNLVAKILEEHEIKGSVVFGGRIPENYILLEEILKKSKEEMSEFPVISYSGLIDLIHNHKETKLDLEDGEDLMTAVRFLTKAGVLYHQADPRSSVRNNFILEPLWLLEKIEKVAAALRKNMALYDVSKPPYLVPAFLMNVTLNSFANAEVSSGVSGIPSKFVPVLLRLMQNRGVIVLVEEDTFFVPSFLEPFPASVGAQTDDAELSADLNQAFLWRILYMDFVPVDFWHRLIARLLGFLKTIFTRFPVYGEDVPDNVKTVCWKKGVTAAYKGSILFSVGALEDTRSRFCLSQRFGENSVAVDFVWTFKSSENIQFGIEVKVMKEPNGHILLPMLMDHVEDLAEEFYPSLLEYDMRGQQHISQHVPCPICLKRTESSEIPLSEIHNSSDVHIFPLSELSQFLESSGMEDKKTVLKIIPDIFCANHPDMPLELADCIPDILMRDYDPAFEAKPLFLLFDVRPASILGEGGFGTVFRGVYAGDEVAIKSLRAGSSTPAYRNLRTELNVLARLSHPSLIRLHGFMVTSDCYPSPLIIMELAPEGSLSTFLSSLEKLSCDEAMEKFPRFMRQRVAVESLEGLWHLHKNRIIFRDMKPDNVLIISMDRSGPITVKLTDFGISVQSTSAGTIGASGSPGYSAPEVVALKINEKQPNGSKIPYTEKCDIFSYGLMLHEIAVCKTPWFLHPGNTSAATAPSNIPDEAILKGILPATISTFDDSLRWPHMQVAVSGCLKRNPDDRPSADKLLRMMKTPEFCCFRKTFELGKIRKCVAFHARQSTISDVKEGADGGLNLPPILEIWTISSARLIQARSPSRTQHAEDFSKSCDTDTLSDQSDFTLNPSDRTQVPPMHDKNMIERQSDALKVSPRPHKGARLQKWAWNSANFANKPKFAQKTGVRNLSNLRKVVVDMKSAQIKEQSSCTIEDDIGEITCIVHVPISSQSGFLDASLKSAGFSSAMNFWASLEGKNIKTSPANQTSTNQDVIVVGTNKGILAKLDISSSMPCTVLMDMRVEITCLYMYENPTCDETSEAERGKPSADNFVLVGLSDGRIAFISASKVLKGNVRRPDHVVCLVESGRLQSVEKITSSDDTIFAACGRQISCILIRDGAGRPRVSATKILPSIAAVDGGNSCISHMAACHDFIFATMRNSSELFVWSMGSQVADIKADLRTMANGKIREPASPGVDTAVATSLLADSARCVLYVGLSSGHVMVLRGVCQQQSQAEASFDVITVVRRHESTVWDLFLAQDVTTGIDLMFACGIGSQSVSSDSVRPRVSRSDLIGGQSSGLEDGDSNSHIAVYDAHMPSISDEMKEIAKLRAREILKYKKHC